MSKKKSPLEEVEGDPSNVKCKVRKTCPGENDKDDTIRVRVNTVVTRTNMYSIIYSKIKTLEK